MMLDAPEQVHANPRAYARQLANYIRDPSTIRARTLDMFGRAPSIEEARRLRQEAEREAEREACFNSYLRPKWDGARNIVELPRKPAAPKPPDPALRFNPRKLVPRWKISHRALIRAVAADFGMDADTVTGPRRTGEIVRVRHLLAYLLRERGYSYARIAGALGRRDHKAAINSCDAFPRLMAREECLAAAYRRYSLVGAA